MTQVGAELTAAQATEEAAHQELIRFRADVLETAKAAHLEAIAAADAQLRQVLAEDERLSKELQVTRNRLAALKREAGGYV